MLIFLFPCAFLGLLWRFQFTHDFTLHVYHRFFYFRVLLVLALPSPRNITPMSQDTRPLTYYTTNYTYLPASTVPARRPAAVPESLLLLSCSNSIIKRPNSCSLKSCSVTNLLTLQNFRVDPRDNCSLFSPKTLFGQTIFSGLQSDCLTGMSKNWGVFNFRTSRSAPAATIRHEVGALMMLSRAPLPSYIWWRSWSADKAESREDDFSTLRFLLRWTIDTPNPFSSCLFSNSVCCPTWYFTGY